MKTRCCRRRVECLRTKSPTITSLPDEKLALSSTQGKTRRSFVGLKQARMTNAVFCPFFCSPSLSFSILAALRYSSTSPPLLSIHVRRAIAGAPPPSPSPSSSPSSSSTHFDRPLLPPVLLFLLSRHFDGMRTPAIPIAIPDAVENITAG